MTTPFYTKQAIRFLRLIPDKEAACAGLSDQHVKNGYKLREFLDIGKGEYTMVFELQETQAETLAESLRSKLVSLQAREPVAFSQLVAGARASDHQVMNLSASAFALLTNENWTLTNKVPNEVQSVVVDVIHEYVHGDGMDLAIRPFTPVATDGPNGNSEQPVYGGGNSNSGYDKKPYDLRDRRNQ